MENDRNRIYDEPATQDAVRMSEAPEWAAVIQKVAESNRSFAERVLLSLTGGDNQAGAERLMRVRSEVQSRIQRMIDKGVPITPPSIERLKKEEKLKSKFLPIQGIIELYRWEEGIRMFHALLKSPAIILDQEVAEIFKEWMQHLCERLFHHHVYAKDGRKAIAALEQLAACQWFDGSRIRSDVEAMRTDETMLAPIRDEVLFAVIQPKRFSVLVQALRHFGLGDVHEELKSQIEERAYEHIIAPLTLKIHWTSGVRDCRGRLMDAFTAGMLKTPSWNDILMRHIVASIKNGDVENFLKRRGTVLEYEKESFSDETLPSNHPAFVAAAKEYLIDRYARPELAYDDHIFYGYGRAASAFATAGIMTRNEFDALPEIRQYLKIK